MIVRPRCERELVDAVRLAALTDRTVRAIGSRHSVKPTYRGQGVAVKLDRYRSVVREDGPTITVQAGMTMFDLNRRLHARGYALPNVGGITAQTVSGFLATGSAGGSLRHTHMTSVHSFRLVLASGEVVNVQRDHPWFEATCVSMGLLGVISEVTFEAEPAYGVAGVEATVPFDRVRTEYSQWATNHDYSRVLWYPELDHCDVWLAERTRPVARSRGVSRFSPTLQYAANAANFVGTRARRAIGKPLLGQFVRPVERSFEGPWHEVLPQDEGLSFHRLPHVYSELWLPLEHATSAIDAVAEYFRTAGTPRMATLPVELYCAPPHDGWLSPGLGRESLRINFIRYGWDPISNAEFFGPLWEALAPFDPRPHWGKYQVAGECGRSIRESCPGLAEFRDLRAKLDPRGILSTSYWREQLALEERTVEAILPRARAAPLAH